MIYPVILRVPDEKRMLSGKDLVGFLKQYARQAVSVSASQRGINLQDLENDINGAPKPSNGFYWSLSHKPGYVAGVVASLPVGIDIEGIRPVRPALFAKVMDERERRLANTISDKLFYRFWTSKETVLKAVGVGLRGLSQCKVVRIIDHRFMELEYRDTHWLIENIHYDHHLIAVVKNNSDIRWIFPFSAN